MNNKSIFSAFAFIVLVSCTSEPIDVLDSQSQGQGSPVRLSFSIEDEVDDQATRSMITASNLSHDSRIGLYALKQTITKSGSKNIYTLQGNSRPKYTWSETNLQANFRNAQYKVVKEEVTVGHNQTIKYFYKPSDGTVEGTFPTGTGAGLRFFAYYPYSSAIYYDGNELGAGDSIQAPMIDARLADKEEDQIDYLYSGPVNVASTKEEIKIPLKHALSRLRIWMRTSTTDWKNNYSPKINTIFIASNTGSEGKLNIATGLFTPTSSRGNYIVRDFNDAYLEYNSEDPTEYNKICDVLLFPDKYGKAASQIGMLFQRVKSVSYKNGIEYFDEEEIVLYDENSHGELKFDRGKVTNIYITYK